MTKLGNEINILEEMAFQKKCSKSRKKHYYTKWYDFYFKSLRHKNNNILEIGVDEGISLEVWREYFYNSSIYGIDKYSKTIPKAIKKDFKIFIGDQDDKEFLKNVCNHVRSGFDIIIDDASHIPQKQIISFKYLFEKLNNGGIYVIEDTYSSYYPKFKNNKIRSSIDFFKKRVDDVNFHGRFKWCNFEIIKKNIFTNIKKIGKREKEPRKLNIYEKNIESIHFCNGLCFIFKR